MDQISIYLKSLVSNAAYELHLEPNKQPFVLSDNGMVEISKSVLSGANISQMIFPIIPAEAKQRLPNQPEIEFSFENPNGTFGFQVKKSPAGFHVIVRPLQGSQAAIGSVYQYSSTDMEPEIVSNSYSDPVTPTVGGTSFSVKSEMTPVAGEKPPARAPSLGYDPDAKTTHYDPKSYTNTNFGDGELTPIDDYYFNAEPEVEIISEQELYQAPQTFAYEPPVKGKKIDGYFHRMNECGASDLHMSVSMPPMVRKDGKIMPLPGDDPALTPEAMKELLEAIMPEKNKEEFEARHDTDFAYEIPGLARFRANIFMDRKGMGGVFRVIPTKILTAEQLNIPKAVLELCNLSKGLVVVTGPTGSGKSTTLAAMMDHLNETREDHVITIEDPIEFVHPNKKCLVNQREVHNHTDSFKDALRAALREDPDVLLVGEMRDLETIAIAIETAETGHLVFGTLHTTTAASTIDRIIDQFPADRQQQIRVMLSESLKGVIAQTLLPKIGGGRIAALEILIVTPAISNLIREGKTFQIPSAMQTGKNIGMQMLNEAMVELCKKGIVAPRDAYLKAVDKTGFEMALTRNNLKMN